jgi:hypothetical protein
LALDCEEEYFGRDLKDAADGLLRLYMDVIFAFVLFQEAVAKV